MRTEPKDTSPTQGNAKNSPNLKYGDILRTQEGMPEPTTETSVYKSLDHTPFVMRCMNNEWFLTMGQYILTKKHKSSADVIKELELEKWNVIVYMIHAVTRIIKELDEQEKADPTPSPLQGQAELRKEEYKEKEA